jgi:hypothetical protein
VSVASNSDYPCDRESRRLERELTMRVAMHATDAPARDALKDFRKKLREQLDAVQLEASTLKEGGTRFRKRTEASAGLEARELKTQSFTSKLPAPIPVMFRGQEVQAARVDKAECANAAMRAFMRTKNAVGPVLELEVVRMIHGIENIEVVRGTAEDIHRSFPDAQSVAALADAGVRLPPNVAGPIVGLARPGIIQG